MANIYTLKSGLASDTTVWSSGTVPVSGDRVFIATGHTVTVDGTYEWGDDSTATVVINSTSTTTSIYVQGTLKASRTVNSQLTCNGECQIASGGLLDYGTELDPIPSSVTATIITNKSATMAHGKYGLSTSGSLNWSGFRVWGAGKTPRTTMSAALATDTVLTVADATGWAVGDWIAYGASIAGGTYLDSGVRAITAISGNQVTIGASIGVASQAGRTLVNLTRNVKIKGYQGNTYRSFVSVYVGGSYNVTNSIEIGPCEINQTGGVTNQWQVGGLNLYWSAATNNIAAVKKIYRPVIHDVFSVSGGTVINMSAPPQAMVHSFGNQAYPFTIEEPVISSQSNSNAFTIYNGASTKILNPHIIRCANVLSCGYSQGPVGVQLVGGKVCAAVGSNVAGTGVSVFVTGTEFEGANTVAGGASAFGELKYTNCTFGGAMQLRNPSASFTSGGTGQYTPITIENCTIAAFTTSRTANNLSGVKDETYFRLRNINNDVTNHITYRNGGRLVRDNSVFYRGQSSLAMYSWFSTKAITHSTTVSVGANSTVRILGYVRFNAAYGTATPPTLTVSGMGITPVVFTCPATADTWFPIDLSITNPQSYPGKFTLDFWGLSAANTEAATCWFDGIAMEDMVTWTRHYGFTYDPANPARTVDPFVQLSEAAAAALTGISYSSGTLTVSGTRSIREIYDWMQWYECSNRLTPIMTSADGVSFTLNANLTLSGSITGSGTIAMTSGTLTSTGTSSVVINHNAGSFVGVAVSGYVAGSRVQIYNVSTATELYNNTPAGASFSINANWTTNQTLRVRVGYAVGTSAKLPVEQTGLLTSTGASFLISQSDDTVYNSLAIDGGTCTEFTPDYPNLQIDISDGDGTTSVQRIYAWAAWNQTSAQGIGLMFKAVAAADLLNYTIDTSVVNAKLDNISATPVKVTGGYLTRSDGSTLIAATSGSIQMDPGRAYIAPATVIDANIVRINGQSIAGSGSESDPWGPGA